MKKYLCCTFFLLGFSRVWAGAFDNGGSWAAQIPTASSVAASAIGISQLSATGTPGATTFLRGDNTWATTASVGDAMLAATQTFSGGNTFSSYTTFSGSVTATSASNTLGGNGAAITSLAPANMSAGTFTGADTFSGAVTFGANLTFSSNTVIDAVNGSFGSVTAGSTSTLTWTEVTDRLSEFVTSSFTAITAGFYEVTAQAEASQTGGTGCLLMKKNGTTIAGGNICTAGGAALATILPITNNRILNLAANDIIRVDGSATTANVTFQNMTLTVKRVP